MIRAQLHCNCEDAIGAPVCAWSLMAAMLSRAGVAAVLLWRPSGSLACGAIGSSANPSRREAGAIVKAGRQGDEPGCWISGSRALISFPDRDIAFRPITRAYPLCKAVHIRMSGYSGSIRATQDINYHPQFAWLVVGGLSWHWGAPPGGDSAVRPALPRQQPGAQLLHALQRVLQVHTGQGPGVGRLQVLRQGVPLPVPERMGARPAPPCACCQPLSIRWRAGFAGLMAYSPRCKPACVTNSIEGNASHGGVEDVEVHGLFAALDPPFPVYCGNIGVRRGDCVGIAEVTSCAYVSAVEM